MAAPYDVRVVFTNEEDGNDSHNGERSVLAISLLLSARSQYFRSALAWNSQDGDSRPSKRQKMDEDTHTSAGVRDEEDINEPGTERASQEGSHPKVLKLVFEDQEDLRAGKCIVQLIQDLALPPDMRPPCPSGNVTAGLLAKMLRWSDYLGSSECVEACMDSLPKLDQAQLQLNDIIQLMSFPHSIISTPSFSKVEGFCKDMLLRAFSDALGGLVDTQLLQQFCSLPFPAVKLFSFHYKKSAEWEAYKSRKANLAHLLASWVINAQSQGCDGHEPAQVAGLLQCEDMNLLCRLPTEAFTKFKPVCTRYLLGRFGDVHGVIVDPKLLSNFCSLAFHLVVLWAGLDELAVGNENDVAVLLTKWCHGKKLSEDQSKQLSSLLRGSQLSRSFRWFVLPMCGWFKPAFDLQVFDLAFEESKSAGTNVDMRIARRHLAAWNAPPRSGELPAEAQSRSECTVNFPQSCLNGLLTRAEGTSCALVPSEPFYCGGFFWRIQLQLNPSDGLLGAYLGLTGKEDLPAPHVTVMRFRISHLAKDGSLPTLISGGPICIKASANLGTRDMFPGLKFTSPAVFEEVLHGGQLVLKVQVSDIK
uniref:Uncharacterized protein n=2 Tax=Dunaliella tertiolecta TaxID=3047 RepID=A0A6S8LZ88_DUNTE|mmetsp:Transcript_20157/g.56137  ORF Transcript_20157/g.56137 Transcript_20157/m.56137 type:complete len:588 (+) Transcript_20157:100-1863(+)